MVKHSQQIAEEMAESAALLWSDENHSLSINYCIINSIPLTQLIEVARAANKIRGDDSKDAIYALDDAIIALKQTGKAEWL